MMLFKLIMDLFNFLSTSKDELSVTIRSVLNYYQLRYTNARLQKVVSDHVDHPSLLTIKDVLIDYGINSVAIKRGEYSYEDFEGPFICSIQEEHWPNPKFVFVTSNNAGLIEFSDPFDGTKKTIAMHDFYKVDKGVLLLLDGDEKVNERNFKDNQMRLVLRQLYSLVFLSIPVALVVNQVVNIIHDGLPHYQVHLCFLLTTFVGLIFTTLLLWYDVDEHNPFLKEMCGKGSKVNCSAVLTSSGSRFLGVDWSVWGFSYFFVFFVSQVLFPTSESLLFVCSVTSVCASFYIFYSIYYQWRVLKQWCRLCLLVQLVLLVNSVISSYYFFKAQFFIPHLAASDILSFVLWSSVIMIIVDFALPALKMAADSKRYENYWKKLKYKSDVFELLLRKSNEVTVDSSQLGIVIGNPDANTEIIKVCNPYCDPCAKAHPVLEQIITSNTDVRLRIIFMASGELRDIRTAPVAHLLAMASSNSLLLKEAIDDWYSQDVRSYEEFRKRYPINVDLNSHLSKIHAMNAWCDKMKIRATPTLFVNGYELPESYQIDELKNVI